MNYYYVTVQSIRFSHTVDGTHIWIPNFSITNYFPFLQYTSHGFEAMPLQTEIHHLFVGFFSSFIYFHQIGENEFSANHRISKIVFYEFVC